MENHQLDFNKTKEILDKSQIDFQGELVTTKDGAIEFAARKDNTVVLKIVSPEIILEGC